MNQIVSSKEPLIKVMSPSFSANKILRRELRSFFSNVVFNDKGERFADTALKSYLVNADAAIVGLEKIDIDVLRYCPKLKIISKYGVGLDSIDLRSCKQRNVAIGWTSGVNKRSVSEMVLSFMIGLGRNMMQTSFEMRDGHWNKSGGFQVSGKTVGIIGVGHVGSDLIRLLQSFDCKILANDIVDKSLLYKKYGVIAASKNEIYRQADFISLHVPLTDKTHYLINEKSLSQFKPSAILINTSRGSVVQQIALKQALMSGRLGAAALDVYEVEPPTDHEFVTLPNLICTPHIGGSSVEGILAMGRSAILHLKEFLYQDIAEQRLVHELEG